VVAFHLDKLAEAGLLDVEYRRPPGRGGPGAGRPAKFYRCAEGEISFSVPPREYEVAGRLLAEAVTLAERDGVPVSQALHDAAREFGRTLGRRVHEQASETPDGPELVDALLGALSDCGYDPRPDGEAYALANCPFHALAERYRDLVCGMNLELMVGFTEELQGARLEARLEPVPGQCCVRLTSAR
jgi:predicted ArsR family transcriptional regulator